MEQDQLKCPKCSSGQIYADKAGFNAKKAIIGDILVGPLGLLAGNSGKNKIILSCLNCGHQFFPINSPEGIKQQAKETEQLRIKTIANDNYKSNPGKIDSNNAFIGVVIVVVIIIMLMFFIGSRH